MILFDNVIFELQRFGGISKYWKNLLSHCSTSSDLQVVKRGRNSNQIERSGHHLFGCDYVNEMFGLGRAACNLTGISIQNSAIFHSSYYRLPAGKAGIRIVSTFHDFAYEAGYKSVFRGSSMVVLKYLNACFSDKIICVSKSTADDLARFYGRDFNKKVEVIYNGVDDIFRVSHLEFSDSLANRALLYVGDRSGKHKFFDEAVALAKELGRALRIVGGGMLSASEKSLLASSLPARHEHLGALSTGELASEYRRAFALIYPSRYEGFGIPIIEAMSSGCPVLAFDIPAFREITADSYPLAPVFSKDHLLELGRRLSELPYRNEIRELGVELTLNYSWSKMGRETRQIYDHLLTHS